MCMSMCVPTFHSFLSVAALLTHQTPPFLLSLSPLPSIHSEEGPRPTAAPRKERNGARRMCAAPPKTATTTRRWQRPHRPRVSTPRRGERCVACVRTRAIGGTTGKCRKKGRADRWRKESRENTHCTQPARSTDVRAHARLRRHVAKEQMTREGTHTSQAHTHTPIHTRSTP